MFGKWRYLADLGGLIIVQSSACSFIHSTNNIHAFCVPGTKLDIEIYIIFSSSLKELKKLYAKYSVIDGY